VKKASGNATTLGGTAGNAATDKYEPCCCTWHIPTSAHSHAKPTLSRATLLKLLADATRAYQSLVPRVLLAHVYTPADSPLIGNSNGNGNHNNNNNNNLNGGQQTFLAVLLDRFLPLTQRQHVPEVSTMARNSTTTAAAATTTVGGDQHG